MIAWTQASIHQLTNTVNMQEEATYICESCGEEIVVPVDLSQGSWQQYTEDCPVCCHPNLITIEVDEDGRVEVRSELEYR